MDVPDVETFGSNKQRKIVVKSTPEHRAYVDVIASVDLPPEATYALLTHPENYKVFSGITRTSPRKWLWRGPLEERYEVQHYTGYSFLWWHGEFRTKLLVTQRPRSHVVQFKLIESDVMKYFDGSWSVKPFNQTSLNAFYGKREPFNPFRAVQGALTRQQPRSLIEFEQTILPKHIPPRLGGVMRRIAAKAMADTLGDMEAEAKRINARCAIIPDLNRFSPRQAGDAGATRGASQAKVAEQAGSCTLGGCGRVSWHPAGIPGCQIATRLEVTPLDRSI